MDIQASGTLCVPGAGSREVGRYRFDGGLDDLSDVIDLRDIDDQRRKQPQSASEATSDLENET